MKPAIAFRHRALLDLLEQFLYLAEEAGTAIAERYLSAVEQTSRRLARHPFSATAYQSNHPDLQGMRRAPVAGFGGTPHRRILSASPFLQRP